MANPRHQRRSQPRRPIFSTGGLVPRLVPALAFCLQLLWIQPVVAQSPITTPAQAFGFEIGDDYQLVNYSQMIAYFQQLEDESDRVRLVKIGKTSEDRDHWMAIVSSPNNLARLEEIRAASQTLAHAQVTENEAHNLAEAGKAVVWIDGGQHANETAGFMQLIETVYQMASRDDPETLRFLEDTVQLYVPANPDGQEMVANWYMRKEIPEQRSLDFLPTLYQKYGGHDNNRDFFMGNLLETRNLSRVLFQDWFPQIVYNHHQPGPAGAIVFVPPFRDPYNYNLDPLIPVGIQAVGTAIQQRLIAEGKGGVVSRDKANYSAWWNGGLRTSAYFHNMIGILTEIVGSPTPLQLPLVGAQLLPTGDNPVPAGARTWHFRQTIDYEITQNRAVLDYASRNRETLLWNIYRMGRNAIDKGSRDNWTVTPSLVNQLRTATVERGRAPDPDDYARVIETPSNRDARAYLLGENDSIARKRFLEILDLSGIEWSVLTDPARIGGKTYPADTIVISTSQPFRAHLRDLFEPQDYPDDFPYPGGAPIAPYDMAGWTLAMQMGIAFERVYDLPEMKTRTMSTSFGTGTYGVPDVPTARIAVYDQYGGLTSSGWTEYVFDQFRFPYDVVYPADLNTGNLAERYDAILIPDQAFRLGSRPVVQPRPEDIPEQYRHMLGELSQDRTLPQLRDFVEQGGHLITVGTSTALAAMLGVPVTDHLIQQGPGGSVQSLPREKFFVPGSLVRATIDSAHPLAQGMGDEAIFFFDASPVFTTNSPDVEVVARYPEHALASGWAWGEAALTGGIAVAEAKVGQGKVVLFGPDPTFRGQSYGVFKLLFNALYDAAARPKAGGE